MASVKITVRKNGPYRVEAPKEPFSWLTRTGTAYDLTGKPAFSLCRCGGSVNKPFCDGTHSKVGFQGAELAVKRLMRLRILWGRSLGAAGERQVLGFARIIGLLVVDGWLMA